MAVIKLKDIRPDVKEDDQIILQRMKKNAEDWHTYNAENIADYKAETKFTYFEDGQWTTDEIKEYNDNHRPRLTFNMIPRILNLVKGEYFDYSPEIAIRPLDSTHVEQDRIDFLTNLTRQMAFKSRTKIVYTTAMDCALSGGFGAFRVVSEPEHPMSFNYVPRYQTINDPTRVFADRTDMSINKENGNFSGLLHTWKKPNLKAKYPKYNGGSSFSLSNDQNIIWETDDDVTVAEYYEKVFFRRKIALLSNNVIVDADEAENQAARATAQEALQAVLTGKGTPPPVTIVKEEEREDFYMRFYVATHDQILERTNWDGKKQPIIIQPGYVKWVDGKERYLSLTKWLKDTQRAYNYARSEFLFRLKLCRYERFIAPEKAIQGYEKDWKNMYQAKGVLLYKDVGTAQPPIHIPPAEIPQSLSVEIERSYNDFQRITGRFDANLGAPSNETSGIAILNRQRPGNLAVQIFFENAERAIETGANVALELAQKTMDTERNVQVAMANGEQSTVTANTSDGKNNITDGNFSVEVKASASFEIQQNAQIEQLIRVIGVNPQLAQVMPDKLIELTGVKDAPAIVKRVQDVMIPNITLRESKDPKRKAELQKKIQQKEQPQQIATQIEMQNAKLQQMSVKNEMQNNTIIALSDRMNAMAKMMDSQTKREEAGQKGVVEQTKAAAEIQKAELELQQEVIKTIGQQRQQNIAPATSQR